MIFWKKHTPKNIHLSTMIDIWNESYYDFILRFDLKKLERLRFPKKLLDFFHDLFWDSFWNVLLVIELLYKNCTEEIAISRLTFNTSVGYTHLCHWHSYCLSAIMLSYVVLKTLEAKFCLETMHLLIHNLFQKGKICFSKEEYTVSKSIMLKNVSLYTVTENEYHTLSK